MEGSFLLTPECCALHLPRGLEDKIEKPNLKKVKVNESGRGSEERRSMDRESGSGLSRKGNSYDVGFGIKLTDEDIEKEIEDLFG